MKEPNFMCLGAPKCGTTSLYEILKQHTGFFLTSFKEPHFFDVDENYKEGYKWYLTKYFNNVEQQKIIGEFTPSYFVVPKAASRINKYLGKETKFLLILRNPVDRAYSQYLHSKRDLIENLTFEDALLNESERLKKYIERKDDIAYIKFSYIDAGLYCKHLTNYLNYFDLSRFKIYIFEEDFKYNRAAMISEICDFLSIEYENINVDIKSNVAASVRFPIIKNFLKRNSKFKKIMKLIIRSKVIRSEIIYFLQKISNKPDPKNKIDSKLKNKLLNKYFIDDIKNLEVLINRDLSVWYSG